ncbi:YibE/F family protein [Bacillus sp. FJAT-42315]|uniref:YibE/F family protein n=1 Tax=Bacillus sp. FJAT-42315 TaxID=2014077 RepID=UPI003FA4A855
MNVFVHKLKEMTRGKFIFLILIALCFISSVVFVYHNHFLYDRPIAKVIDTSVEDTVKLTDEHHNKDQLVTQKVTAVIQNGEEKGEHIELTNKYSLSGVYDQVYQVGNELFVAIDTRTNEEANLTGHITNVKRDKYIVIIGWVFLFTLLIVGQRQGVLSIISFALNAVLLSYALDVYVNSATQSLLWICGITAILFTIISLVLVNGLNEKTYAAIATTLMGTFTSLLITYLAMWVTAENGLHYEEMQFLTRPYQLVFMAGLLIGSLGAVMDVAITMSSSIFELHEKNPNMSMKALKTSGLDIGRNIMGTITSILFFAYISGSIPVLILYLKNGVPLGFTFSMTLSLEVARALAGAIGIVLTIPISLYTSMFFVNRKRARS